MISDIIKGYTAIFERITPPIRAILEYEPTAIVETPTLYTVLDSVVYTMGGGVQVSTVTLLHRLIFQWQDNEQAEIEIWPYAEAVRDAVALDAQLGGAVQSGIARVDRMQAGWIAVGGVECRVMDFYSVTVSKNSLQAVRSAA